MPVSRWRRFSSKRIRSRSFASRFESGSSSSSSRGLPTMARASASRCCWPPLSSVAGRSARWPICISSSASCTACLISRRLIDAAALQREGDVLRHRHVRPDRVGLEDHAEAALVRRHERRGRRVEHGAAVDDDPARVRPLEPGDRAEHRRLAGARRAEDREQPALGHGEAHTVECLDRSTLVLGERLVEVGGLEHGESRFERGRRRAEGVPPGGCARRTFGASR